MSESHSHPHTQLLAVAVGDSSSSIPHLMSQQRAEAPHVLTFLHSTRQPVLAQDSLPHSFLSSLLAYSVCLKRLTC